MISQVFRLLTIGTLVLFAIALTPPHLRAQTGGLGGDTSGGGTGLGGDTGLGGVTDTNVGGSTVNTGSTTNTGTNQGTSSGGGGGSAGQLPDLSQIFDIAGNIPVLEDKRRAGFVGPTSDLGSAVGDAAPPTGFVGPNADAFAAGASTTGGNASRAGGTTRTPGQQPGTGQQNGFVVTRQNIRSRVRAAFQAPPVDGDFVATRFENRMRLQPSMASLANSFGNNVRVDVQNRTAVVTGSVPSADQADRIIRQLRLEPGVYRIDNRLSVGN